MNEHLSARDVRAVFVAAVETELSAPAGHGLRQAVSDLSGRYRSGDATAPGGFSETELRAYLATRLPATFAATRRVLSELAGLRPGWVPASVLDLGAGPGTATWAAFEVFGPVAESVCVEHHLEMAALGARLQERARPRFSDRTSWVVADAAGTALPASDLVVAAYLLGELGRERELSALGRWWAATRGALVLVEPGTPVGFGRLRAARSALIDMGAHVTAPCPHDGECPMSAPDWCHFAVRLERSPLHRELKGAKLGYEDEKYAYLVVSSEPVLAGEARLVRAPRQHKGHVRLLVCEAGGLHERVVSRRDGDLYKRARGAKWGDRLPLP